VFHWVIGPHQMLVLPFAFWLFIAIAIMPKLIRNPRVLGPLVMVIGAVLAWVASLASPFPWTVSENMLFAIRDGRCLDAFGGDLPTRERLLAHLRDISGQASLLANSSGAKKAS